MLAFLPLRVAAQDLQLDDVVTETGRFAFTRMFSDPVDDAIDISRDAVIGSSRSYDVWMERDGVREVPQYDYFKYEIYVRPRANPRQVTHVFFQGRPGGGFDDQLVNVPFTVEDGMIREEGTIVLPIFGYVTTDALSSRQPDEPASAFLATDEDISVPLTNELEHMPVTITGVSASPRDPTLWKALEIRGASGAFTPFLLGKGATNKGNLRIRLRPRTPQAFAAALIHGRGKEDDVITVLVTYKTLAREERSYPISVRVQFVPWPPVLLVMAVVGVPFGWLVRWRVEKAKRGDCRDPWQLLWAGMLAALLVEVLGMLLVRSGSELKIFHFQMDPFQLLPAFLIGVIAGLGGCHSLNFLRKILMGLFKIIMGLFFKSGGTGMGSSTWMGSGTGMEP